MDKEIKELAGRIAKRYGITSEDRQDIEVICLSKILTLAQDKKHYSYMKIVMQNAAKDFIKKNKPTYSLRETENLSYEIEEEIINRLDQRQLAQEIISHLGEEDRRLFHFLINGFSIAEISNLTGATENSIRVKVFRKILELRKVYEKKDNR